MPTITFGPGAPGSIDSIINIIDVMSFDADVVGFTPSLVTLSDGVRTFLVHGTGFNVTMIGGEPYLTGGTIQTIEVTQGGTNLVTISSANLAASALAAAIFAENNGSDPAAVETLLTGLNWTYNGTAAADVLLPTSVSGDGILINMRGNDVFRLGGGADTVFAGDGNDSLYGGNARDRLDGGAGNDLVYGGSQNDMLYGGTGNDTLDGGAHDDRLFGGAGNDILRGGEGNDTLQGGAGRDIMTGGDGEDVFLFLTAAEMGNGTTRDQIRDFISGEDRLDLSALDFAYRGTKGFTGTKPEMRFYTNGTDGFIQIDADGNKSIDYQVQLLGVTSLAAGDIIL